MSANDQGIIAVSGRAHCQRQVALFWPCFDHARLYADTLIYKHIFVNMVSANHGSVWSNPVQLCVLQLTSELAKSMPDYNYKYMYYFTKQRSLS